ncbi:MAG TPA: FecR domain-containing protein [Thermoanaerobaculaceae bacterium]|nr:FecR domain-containing protein [Thermoanaerobaculaceae bacterium]HPS76698.1 FecR domain-containing protein [Thermoanaerobaculaceae bacterium]
MTSRLSSLLLVAALIGAGTVAYADDDLTSLSYISYLERYATIYPAAGEETLDAQVNMPVLVGDRLDTARGARIEVQLADGCTIWLDEFSTLDFDSLAMSRDTQATRTALNLVAGGLVIEIPANAQVEENLRIDTKRGSVFLSRPGLYRLEFDREELHVETHSGLAELPVGVGSAMLRTGQQTTLEEDQDDDIRRSSLDDDSDDFWAWVEERRRPRDDSRTARYVDERNAGRAAVLDTFGEWVYVDSYSSWAWRPRVGADWRPYSQGRWLWTPVGWTWVSYEPWGWYPYHYGSWNYDNSFGWVWCWDWVWGPAWVHWMWADNYVGWSPRGYYDRWYWDNCPGCHGGDHRWPDRWSHTAFDFSGRVRLRDIDPRPWTFVPGDRFGSSHLDRVRVDSDRLLREIGDRGEGFVRSGPLVTRTPGRDLADRGIGDLIRRGAGDRQTPDLGAIFRRDAGGIAREPASRAIVTPSRTGDLISRTLPSRTALPPDQTISPRVRERIEPGTGRSSPGAGEVPGGARTIPDRTTPDRRVPGVDPGFRRTVPVDENPPDRSTGGRTEDGNRGRVIERGRDRTDTGRAPDSDRSRGETGAGTDRSPARTDPGRDAPATRPDSGSSRTNPEPGRTVERAPAPPPPADRGAPQAQPAPPVRERSREQVSFRARALNAPEPRFDGSSSLSEARSRMWGSTRTTNPQREAGRTRQDAFPSRRLSRQDAWERPAIRRNEGSSSPGWGFRRASSMPQERLTSSRSERSYPSSPVGSYSPGSIGRSEPSGSVRSYPSSSGSSRSWGSTGRSEPSGSARSSSGSSTHSYSSPGPSRSSGSVSSSRSSGSSRRGRG